MLFVFDLCLDTWVLLRGEVCFLLKIDGVSENIRTVVSDENLLWLGAKPTVVTDLTGVLVVFNVWCPADTTSILIQVLVIHIQSV